MASDLLDLLLVAYVARGALSGFRRGLIAKMAALAAAIVALLVASVLSATALAVANRAFHVSSKLGVWMAQQVHLPATVAAAPASRVFGQFSRLAQQLQHQAALRALMPSTRVGLPAFAAGETAGQYVSQTLTHSLLTAISLVVVFFVLRAVLRIGVRLFARRTGRAWPGGAGSWLGLLVGAAERILVATALLAGLVGAAHLPGTGWIANMISNSHLARGLIAADSFLPPGLRDWLAR